MSWRPTAQQVGSHTITISAIDPLGQGTTQTFELVVTGSNLAPLIASNPGTQGSVEQAYTYQVMASDPEGDLLEFGLGEHPEGMTIDTKTGLIRWTPMLEQLGRQIVTVEVSDSLGASTEQTFSIVVSETAVNQAPTITSQPQFTATTGETYSYNVTGSDPDGDAVIYRLLNAPQGMTIDPDRGYLRWTNPTNGNHQVTVTGIDSHGAEAVQAFTLNIIDNAAPIINSTPTSSSTSVGQTYRYDLRATDSDGDALTYQLITAPVGMTIDSLGRVRWTPNHQDIGDNAIEVAVIDSRGARVTQSFTLNVTVDAIAPRVRVTPSVQPVALGESVTLYVRATDNLGVESLSLTVNDEAVPLTANGLFTFTPEAVGEINAVATATDAAGNSSTAISNFEVLDFTDVEAPIISLSSFAEDTITAPIEIIGTVNDDNLQYYTLEVAKLDSDNFQEIFRGTEVVDDDVLGIFDPTLLENDAYTLRLTAVDAGGNSVFEERAINVEGDLKLGNYQLSFTDLSIPVSGIPISITRTYDTLTAQERDDFGYGWRLEFRDTNLRTSLGRDEYYETFDIIGKGFSEGDKIFLTLPGGKREAFTFRPQLDRLGAFLRGAAPGAGGGLYRPRFVSESDSNNVLTVEDVLIVPTANGDFAGLVGNLYNPMDSYFGGQYTLTTGEGIVYEIDAKTGDLLTVTEPNNNRLTFSEDRVVSDTGVEVVFNRDVRGRITSIVDPSGHEIGYEYDGNGDLVKVIDREGNETRFEYSEQREHYLETIIDPLDREAVRTEYDENGRLKRVLDVDGEAVELVYDLDNSTQTSRDVFGNETTYVYDLRGNILTEIDPVGKVTRRTYDEENNLLSETVFTDESGEAGWTNTFTYDGRNNVTSVTDRLGHIIRYTYDKNGDLLSVTDPLGNTTRYGYDAQRNLILLEDAAGNITEYGYDKGGNLILAVDANGASSHMKYDLSGNLIETEDALGNKVHFTYDRNNQLVSQIETVSTPNGLQEIIYRWNYSLEGRITSIINPEGNSTNYEYDANGYKISQTDVLSNQTQFVYNNNGSLIETIYPDQTPEDISDNPKIVHLYDRDSRRRATIDQSGRITHYNYNALGWLVETIYPDSTDELSLLIATIADNQTPETINWVDIVYPDSTPEYLNDNPRVSTEYYQNGWVKAEIDQRGNRTEYRYSDRGELIEEIYPDLTPDDLSDNPRTTWTYNAEGDLISFTNSLGHKTRYQYDQLNRLTETYFPDGTSTSVTYDALDRRTSFTDQAGNTTQYRYDANGQLTGVRDALGNWTEYGYDEVGRLIWIEDAEGRRTSYEYNRIDQRTSVTLPNQQRSESNHNALGYLDSFTDFNQQTTTYSYDQQNRLVSKNFSDDTAVNYTYTPTNNLATITDSRGVTVYEYDERDRLIARTDPSGIYLENGSTIEYDYDVASNLISLSTPGGVTTYSYDERNRLNAVSDSSQGTTNYFYDNFSNLIKTEFSNGVVETRQYNPLNQLTNLKHASGGTILSSYSYTLDPVGNRLSVVENNGRLVEYEYDNLYRLTQEEITDSSDSINNGRIIKYSYDNVGNRLLKDDSHEGITQYQYNQNDWLLSETVEKEGETISFYEYDYDNNGNTISRIKDGTEETLYLWNPQNRLIGLELPDGSQVSYVYDVDGNRVSSTVDGETTHYLIDTNQLNPQVIEEYINETLETRYVQGIDLISQEKIDEISVYLGDGLGSFRILTDKDGNITDTYFYDAFGELILSSGDTDNSFLYAGEQYDENLDGYYLRQRYYDFSTGRFVSQDPFEGILSDPLTLHNFTYVHNNPVMNTDPSGLLLSEWQAVLVKTGILSSTNLGVSLTQLGTGAAPCSAVGGLLAIGSIASYCLWKLEKEVMIGLLCQKIMFFVLKQKTIITEEFFLLWKWKMIGTTGREVKKEIEISIKWYVEIQKHEEYY